MTYPHTCMSTHSTYEARASNMYNKPLYLWSVWLCIYKFRSCENHYRSYYQLRCRIVGHHSCLSVGAMFLGEFLSIYNHGNRVGHSYAWKLPFVWFPFEIVTSQEGIRNSNRITDYHTTTLQHKWMNLKFRKQLNDPYKSYLIFKSEQKYIGDLIDCYNQIIQS